MRLFIDTLNTIFLNIKLKNILIFLLFFSFYLLWGLVSSNYNILVRTRFDLFYDIDTSIKFASIYMDTLQGIDRSPFIFVLTPIVKLLNLFIPNKMFCILFLQSIVATINNFILYIILDKINVKKITIIFFVLIYALSFSTLLFTFFPEKYIYSSFLGLLLTYIIMSFDGEQNYKATQDESVKYIMLTSLLCILGLGINIINIVLYIPILAYFFSLYPKKERCIAIILFIICFSSYFAILYLCGEYFYSFSSSFSQAGNALHWFNVGFSIEKVIQVFQETFIAPFYALSSYFDAEKIEWNFHKQQSILYFIPCTVLLLLSILKGKNIKNNNIIWAFLAVVILHFMMNFIYNDTWFLYSQNYLFYIIVIMAYFYSNINKRIQIVILSMFLLTQIYINYKIFMIFMLGLNKNIILSVSISLVYVIITDIIIVSFISLIKLFLTKYKKTKG